MEEALPLDLGSPNPGFVATSAISVPNLIRCFRISRHTFEYVDREVLILG